MNAGPPPLSSPDSEWSGYSNYHHAGPRSQSPGYPPHGRGNIMTPPMSGSSNGTQPRMSSGMPGRPTGPSPPNSVAARSSTMSSSETRRRQTMHMEDRLNQHYTILKRYLGQSLRDEKGNMKPNKARDKLLRLSGVQFQELSTDVYDELLRRQSAQGQQTNGPGQVPHYLLPRENFHPKRNQARQKLATLPPPRFRDLATDVFYELERRFPPFAGRDIPRNGSPLGPPSRVGTPNSMRYGARNQSLSGQVMGGIGIPGGSDDPYGRPTAKQFQSNTIIPNKSTMVEDDDDDGLSDVYASRRDTTYTARSIGGSEKDRKVVAEFETQVNELQGKVKELEDALREKGAELDRLGEQEKSTTNKRQRFSDLQADLEAKIRSARDFNESLQAELDEVRGRQVNSERDLRSQIGAMADKAQGGTEWKSRYEALDKNQQELRSELSQQEKLTNEVRQEAVGFLDQMKAISKRSMEASEREESLLTQLHRLETELKDWKTRYARAKSLSGPTRSSNSLSVHPADAKTSVIAGGFTSHVGLIKAMHITKYQVAVDDLLHRARSEEPQAVLAYVKAVVIAVRSITLDVGQGRLDNPDATEQSSKLKLKVSATANNLITAAKNFALSQGFSPLSLLDAAASHLSSSIIELSRVVKIDMSSADELEDDANSDIVDSPADYYGLSNGRTSVGAESTYSTDSKPRLTSRAFSGSNQRKPLPNGISNGVAPRQLPSTSGSRDGRIEELKNFLDSRTDTLRGTLQDLVSSIRTSAPPPDILDAIASITSTTSQIIHQTSQLVPTNSEASETAASLIRLVESLEDKGRQGEQITTEAGWKEYVNGIPPIGFEIARGVKELGAWVDGEVRGGDFS